ncbi:MAG: 1-acylglycerol-3-phosphate O-acyltransferase [Lachnospiraceae bacterium]|jgi:1-acyl-sn-glycerol-3-phosphate acyltransferase|nr:1-acylglycerol-3-phosphate O-acyltransferase [Lachnospiraceae bacterium]
MLKTIFVVSFVIIFLIVTLPLLIIEWIIGRFNMSAKNRSSLSIVKWAFRVCLWITGVTITVLGEENVPLDTAVLYVGNHRSYFDILMTYIRVPRPTGYIAKKEMQRFPLLRNWMYNLHCLFLDRKDIKQGLKTILSGIEKVKSGISICIFPEGTRNKVNHTFLPFHDGSFKIAEKSGCPVIPISINNSAAIFEDHLPKMKKAHVVIEYGTPIIISELEREEKKRIGEHVQKIIAEIYYRNARQYFSYSETNLENPPSV